MTVVISTYQTGHLPGAVVYASSMLRPVALVKRNAISKP